MRLLWCPGWARLLPVADAGVFHIKLSGLLLRNAYSSSSAFIQLSGEDLKGGQNVPNVTNVQLAKCPALLNFDPLSLIRGLLNYIKC